MMPVLAQELSIIPGGIHKKMTQEPDRNVLLQGHRFDRFSTRGAQESSKVMRYVMPLIATRKTLSVSIAETIQVGSALANFVIFHRLDLSAPCRVACRSNPHIQAQTGPLDTLYATLPSRLVNIAV
jgi:hypothetical protein